MFFKPNTYNRAAPPPITHHQLAKVEQSVEGDSKSDDNAFRYQLGKLPKTLQDYWTKQLKGRSPNDPDRIKAWQLIKDAKSDGFGPVETFCTQHKLETIGVTPFEQDQ